MKKITQLDIIKKKGTKEKIIALTAYEYSFAQIIDNTGVDIILVGDSLGNVFAGYENTIPVTTEQMLYHTKAVARATKRSLVVADMPFLSYQVSLREAKINAGRLIQEGGAAAVKLETGFSDLDVVEAISNMGIAVMGHIGFTPQSVHKLGGYKVQGREKEQAIMMIELAKRLEEKGCFAIVLEMVPQELAKTITAAINIPTISCGAGKYCDGQIVVTQDILGLFEKTPKFIKKYTNLREEITKAVGAYKKEINSGKYPSEEYSYN
ncbi:3-methyl-2-oxobutanoate hydroxymethyltransferase [Candidatus Margulisiibacteriota bacterium]